MREIKFRVYLGGRFNYWGFIDNGFAGLPSTNVESVTLKELEKRSQQYTGLKDKNGEEIYEGDKYQWQGHEVANGKQIRPIRTEVVIWDYHELSRISNIMESNGTLEIIGNIYEHPELLEVNP